MQRTPVYNGHFFEFRMVSAIERFHCMCIRESVIKVSRIQNQYIKIMVNTSALKITVLLLCDLIQFCSVITVFEQQFQPHFNSNKISVFFISSFGYLAISFTIILSRPLFIDTCSDIQTDLARNLQGTSQTQKSITITPFFSHHFQLKKDIMLIYLPPLCF